MGTKQYLKIYISVFLLMLLGSFGCSPNSTEIPQKSTISGHAGGSVLIGSEVAVFAPDSKSPIASGITDSNGMFTVEGVPHGGPYLLRLTGGKEWRASLSGSDRLIPVETSIYALIPTLDTDINAQISPLSEYAYWIAKAYAGSTQLSEADAMRALQYVSGLTGVDVLSTPLLLTPSMSFEDMQATVKARSYAHQLEASVRTVMGEDVHPAHNLFTYALALRAADAVAGLEGSSVNQTLWSNLQNGLGLTDEELEVAREALKEKRLLLRSSFKSAFEALETTEYENVLEDVLNLMGEEFDDADLSGYRDELKTALLEELPDTVFNPVVEFSVTPKHIDPVIRLAEGLPAVGEIEFTVAGKYADGTTAFLPVGDVHMDVNEDMAAYCDVQPLTLTDEEGEGVTGGVIKYDFSEAERTSGEILVTCTLETRAGTAFNSEFPIEVSRRDFILKTLSLSGTIWDGDKDTPCGLDIAEGEFREVKSEDTPDAGEIYELQPFPIQIAIEAEDDGSPLPPDATLHVVLETEQGQFAPEGSDIFARKYEFALRGDSTINGREFLYRTQDMTGIDVSEETLTLTCREFPKSTVTRSFKVWRNAKALRDITVGEAKIAWDAYKTCATISYSLEGVRYDGQPATEAFDSAFVLRQKFKSGLEEEGAQPIQNITLEQDDAGEGTGVSLVLEYTPDGVLEAGETIMITGEIDFKDGQTSIPVMLEVSAELLSL